MTRRLVVFALMLLTLGACSHDDFVGTPVVGQPIYQAPPPPSGPMQMPPGYPPMTFQPQMPPGYPPQYYAFVPIDYYMRNNPQLQGYWVQFWNGWVNYAGYAGYQQYDFNAFWFDYCPQAWYGTSYWDLYQAFDQGFYYWMYPGAQLPSSCDASYFWGGYSGYYY